VFLLPFNVLWLLLIVFFFSHFVYRIGDSVYQFVETYLLVGLMEPSFYLSLMNATFFHLFFVFFFLMGVGTILISIKTAEEQIRPWKQKVHYGTFLTLYPFLFAMFWIAAFTEELYSGERQW